VSKDVRKTYPALHEDKLVQWGYNEGKSAQATYIWFSVGGFNAAMDCLTEPAGRKEVAEAVQ